MKKLAKLLSLVLSLCLVLSAFSFASAEGEKYEVDKIRVGVASLPGNMDPTIGVGNATIRLHYNIYETLIYADQDNGYALSPMLATGWERVDDYTLRVTLRDDVTWHNGDKFTSKDVKFSFERFQRDDIDGISLAKSLMNTIDHVDIIDDYTCDIVTNCTDPLLETRLSSNWGAWILPCDYMSSVTSDEFTLAPVGTGPYKVVEVSPEKVVMERYDGYWGEKAYIKNLEYFLYAEVSTRITALLTGECDVIAQIPVDQVATVGASKGVKVITSPIENMHLVQFYISENTVDTIIGNKTFRQALSYAVDRQLLSDAFWGGAAIVPKGHQYLSYGEEYFDDYPSENEHYDLEKAKELLAESGYNGEEIVYELKSGYYTFGNEVAEAIVDMWKQIGVNARVEYKDKNDDATMVRNWSNSMRFPDHAGGLWLLWGSKVKDWVNMPEEFKAAGAVLVSSMDQEERMAAARTLMDIFEDEVPAILFYYPSENWGVRDGLEWHPYSSQTMNFRAEGFWATEPQD